MDAIHDPSVQYEKLIGLVRLARQLEMEGYYNAAKLFWAFAFSDEIRASRKGLEVSHETLERRMIEAIEDFSQRGASAGLIVTLESARQAVHERRSPTFAETPEVSVCRTCGEIAVGPVPAQCPGCGGFELTFRTFPPVHYLEPLSPTQALDALATVPPAVHRLIDGLSEDQLNQPPRPGEWSIREVLAHLLGAQELVAYRIDKMLAEDHPSLKAVGLPVAGENLSSWELFEQFRRSREAMVSTLRGIAPLDWWRTGEHEEFSTVTILQQASYFAKHDHAHLTQIERIRRDLRIEP